MGTVRTAVGRAGLRCVDEPQIEVCSAQGRLQLALLPSESECVRRHFFIEGGQSIEGPASCKAFSGGSPVLCAVVACLRLLAVVCKQCGKHTH